MKRDAIKPFNPLQGLKDLDNSISDYLQKHIQHNKDRAEGYGSPPQMEGAGVINRPKYGDVYGAMVIKPRRKKSVA